MIINAYPPNIEQIKAVFPIRDTTIYTYAPYVYNPFGHTLDRAIIKHEIVHLKQQGRTPDKWWARYLIDTEWRLEQEVEAYKAQYKKAKQIYKVKSVIENLLKHIATDLSSDMYGNIVSYDKAIKLIKGRI